MRHFDFFFFIVSTDVAKYWSVWNIVRALLSSLHRRRKLSGHCVIICTGNDSAVQTDILSCVLVDTRVDKAELEVFRSNRRYKEHTVPFTNHNLGNQALYEQDFEHYDESNWLDALPEETADVLRELPEEQLKAFYLYRVEEYTQQEIAVILNTSQPAIFRMIGEIDEILSNVNKTRGPRRLYNRGGRKNASENLEN